MKLPFQKNKHFMLLNVMSLMYNRVSYIKTNVKRQAGISALKQHIFSCQRAILKYIVANENITLFQHQNSRIHAMT